MTTSAGKADETYAKLDKFDGSDPASYRKWRRKAEPMLLALPTTFEKTRWGPKLMEYITGVAEELLEHIKIEEMCKETGYQLLLKALDEKYLERAQEEIQKYLQEYFYKSVIKHVQAE